MDALVIVGIFLVITLITAALFCGWAVWAVLRFFYTLATRPAPATTSTGNGQRSLPRIPSNGHPRLVQHEPSLTDPLTPDTVRCAREGCWAHNPSTAKFCRRCGASLRAGERAPVRRAAVW